MCNLNVPRNRVIWKPTSSIPKEADIVIWWTHVVVMFVFTMEIVLRSYSQRGFFGGFYFTLDTIATLSIVIDFLPLMITSGVEEDGATDAFRAAKSARVGTRIARLVRVVRVIRVIKLFVSARGLKKSKGDEDGAADADEGAPSELSKALQGQIAKKTIVFVSIRGGAQSKRADSPCTRCARRSARCSLWSRLPAVLAPC